MEQPLEIHLAKPGGGKEGPFSLSEINLALAARKYRSGDYWAWHKGMEEWVPLYDIKGIIRVSSLAASLATETPERTNSQQALSGDEISELPTGCVGGVKEDVTAQQPLASSPAPELSESALQDSLPEDFPSPHTAKTEGQGANVAPPLVQNTDLRPAETPAESVQAADPELEPAEPLPPLSANEPSELSRDEVDELVNADRPKGSLAAEEPPASSPALQDSIPDLWQCGPAEQETAGAATPVTENTEEQPMEARAEDMRPDAAPVESGQEPVPDAEPGEPVEPLSADEAPQVSQVSKDAAHELVDKAETAATILARLKQSFFHNSEPANGVTSYFNARRSPLPGMAETGTPPLGEEWGMPEASHPLDFHSKAVPKVPEDGSSPGPETDPAAALLAQQFSSGMPFAALEQLFIFTTGDGRSIWISPLMSRMLEAIVGEKMERIRQGTPRDVIFNCDLSKLLKRDGAISDAVWHAMEIREPNVVARAQKKLSRTCVRTFNLERDTVVALVLFYNNQKLENGSAALGSVCSGTTRFTLPVNAGSSGSEHPR
jgi:hypothetical protein